ncbi:hypothetical protein [Limnoglobus roseus]|uniref:SGNH/GDSL hydrolase family protein n=1 Tax=Limnoglobus roseus TaxID=2598579 RepID=A0A5C1A3W9_9BACT|nr:hypothetical protein [Limnoglobus roseus]QEL13300.1 hypothetical protein PX52LOC_00154 [Limnoglobus roseus]
MPQTLPRLFAARRPLRTAPRAKRRHARAVVIASLFAIAALSAGLGLAAELYPRIRDPLYGDKLAKLQAKLREPNRGPLVMMLGSSRSIFAFDAGRVEGQLREAGRSTTAFNFGVPASGPITHLLYARRLFRDGTKPDLLLLEILPSMLTDLPAGPQESRWLYADRLTHRELDTVIGLGFDAETVRGRWRESTLTPWYGLRFQLLGRVLQSWIPWTMRHDWSRTTDAHGWSTPMIQTLTAEQRATAVEQARAEYTPLLFDWKPGGPAVEAFRTLLRECRENGVPVKLVLMPEGSEFRSWYSPAVRDRLTAFVRQTAAEFGCDAIDAREWLPDDAFTDGHHQLRVGAEAFSDRLTREVILPWRKEHN